MSDTTAPHRVRSADSTRIAFDRSGDGPALILVEAAAHARGFSSFDGQWHTVPDASLAPVLIEFFRDARCTLRRSRARAQRRRMHGVIATGVRGDVQHWTHLRQGGTDHRGATRPRTPRAWVSCL